MPKSAPASEPQAAWRRCTAIPVLAAATAVDVQRTIFHLLDEPIPTLADPFPREDPLPGAHELHLPADNVTIWYTVAAHEGQDVISVRHVSLDT
jgi:hypothetical protein